MKRILLAVGLIITLLLFIQNSNKSPETIKIGFVAGLSGKYSSLGNDVKDGIVLAFDEIQYKIDDTDIELIQKDDRQNKEEAKNVIDEFIKSDVKLIIGNSTSSMTKISIKTLKEEKNRLLISATASSNEFSHLEDNFIRTQVANNYMKFNTLSKYIVDRGEKNIVSIYDPNNASYSKGFIRNFQKSLIHNGGNELVDKIAITDSYESIKAKINSHDIDSILIIANSIDSAKLIQYLKLNKIDKPIICSGWAKTLDFIDEGGKSVEDVIFTTGYDDNSEDKNYLKFVKLFEKKHGKKPSVFSAQAYETASIVIRNLKKSNNLDNLQKNILSEKEYKGLQGNIVFDKFGDVNREYFMMSVKNGKYIRVSNIE